ncbi:hypothetical protein BG004_007419 [Podila humilis]|nr:hypothetical protein BG004_007419 [Podila humilis]
MFKVSQEHFDDIAIAGTAADKLVPSIEGDLIKFLKDSSIVTGYTMSAFGPGGGASGAKAMRSGHAPETLVNDPNHGNTDHNRFNWMAGGAGDDGAMERGRGRGQGGSSNLHRGRGGNRRGNASVSYMATGNNHQMHRAQHIPHQSDSYRSRGGGRGSNSAAHFANTRGGGFGGAPGQFRSIQYRPSNNSIVTAGQNAGMGDSDMSSESLPMGNGFGSELRTGQLHAGRNLSSGPSHSNPRSAPSSFGTSHSAFSSASGLFPSTSSSFEINSNIAGATISTMTPGSRTTTGNIGFGFNAIDTASSMSKPRLDQDRSSFLRRQVAHSIPHSLEQRQ